MHATKTRWFLILGFAALFGAAPLPAAEPKPQSTVPPAGKVEQVVVVFKTHFDIGYTQLAREVVERYRTTMIDKALAVCDASEKLPPENRFVWTIPGWPMQQILWPGQTPERRQRIEKAIREGRLVWHALAGTTHTESMGLEDLVRSLGFSSRLARQFNQPLPRDAKMTDVPCHTWVVPTVLKRAGVDFLHLGCNSASGSPDVPVLFWWEGPDGSRLLTMYTAEGYGTDLKPPANWPHKTWLALIHTGDNHGPPEPGEVQQLLDRARKELPGVKIRMGRLSDFGDAILAEEKQRPALPVIRKDMPDTWIHGIMSMPGAAYEAHYCRSQVFAAEGLNTLVRLHGLPVPTIAEGMRQAYEKSFLYSEHTWGASSRYYSPRLYGDPWRRAQSQGKYEYAEESWREHEGYPLGIGRGIFPRLSEDLVALAKGVSVSGPRVVLYNPLPWPRSETVLLSTHKDFAPTRWHDAATGEPVYTRTHRTHMWLAARDVPGLGYRTYVPAVGTAKVLPWVPYPERARRKPSETPPSERTQTLENLFFRVQVDVPRGVVTSLVDKRTGRELVDRKSPYGFGQYLYERFDKDYHTKFLQDYCKSHPGWVDEFGRANLPPASEVRYLAASPRGFYREEPVSADGISFDKIELVCERDEKMGHGFRLEVELPCDRPYVQLTCSVNKGDDPWPEAGWLCLPFAIRQPTFRLGRLGSIIDPAKDILRGANFEMFALDPGLTIAGQDGAGVGVSSIDFPLVSLGRPGAFRFSREFGTREPTVLVNLYNNIWGTNFRQWIAAYTSAKVRIWATQGTDDEQNLITPGWEARSRWQSQFFDGPAGKLPPTMAGIELSRKGVLVTAFGPNPDGEGILLRLWEQSGQDGACRVRLPEGLRQAKAQPCDLRGRPGGAPLEVRDGTIEVPLTRFAPASVILTK